MKHDWKIVVAGCLVTSTALADTVTLLNGDRLSGTLVRLEADILWLKTAYAGTLKLPWAQVGQVDTDAPVRVRLADGAEMDGRLQTDRARQVRIRMGSLAETAPLALDRIAAINPARQGGRTELSGRASLGGNLARGNSDAETLHLDGELVARTAIGA